MNLIKAYEALLAGERVTIGGAECTLDEGSGEMQIPHAEMARSYTVYIPARLFEDDAFEVVEEPPELKPCPVCGNAAYRDSMTQKTHTDHWVTCGTGYLRTTHYPTQDAADEAWNTRPLQEEKGVQKSLPEEPMYVDCPIYANGNWLFFDIPDDVYEVDLRMASDHVGFVGFVYRDGHVRADSRYVMGDDKPAMYPVAVRIKKAGRECELL